VTQIRSLKFCSFFRANRRSLGPSPCEFSPFEFSADLFSLRRESILKRFFFFFYSSPTSFFLRNTAGSLSHEVDPFADRFFLSFPFLRPLMPAPSITTFFFSTSSCAPSALCYLQFFFLFRQTPCPRTQPHPLLRFLFKSPEVAGRPMDITLFFFPFR